MSCPAVNLPLPSHREDLLSSIYLFATRTMEGPRPAELFIITPPTIPQPAASPKSCRCQRALTRAGLPAPVKGLAAAGAAGSPGQRGPRGSEVPGAGLTWKAPHKGGAVGGRPDDSHRPGKLILPLWGCLARASAGPSSHPESLWGHPELAQPLRPWGRLATEWRGRQLGPGRALPAPTPGGALRLYPRQGYPAGRGRGR